MPWHILVAVLAFALALRVPVAVHVARGLTPEQIEHDLHWDSRDYVDLARNLAAHHALVPPGPPSHEQRVSAHYALLRTPGYPVFLAGCIKLGMNWGGIFLIQAMLLSLVPACAAAIMHWLAARNWLTATAGVVAALSPTGIGLSGMILVDGPFGVAMAIALVALWRAIGRRSLAWSLGAGLALSIGLLIKPTLLYFPLLLPIAWLALARGLCRRVAWLHVLIAIALPLMTAAGWCWRNERCAGRWMYSSIAAQNLRHFVAVSTQTNAAGQSLSFSELESEQWEVRKRDWEDMTTGRLGPAQIAERQTRESIEIIRAHPWIAIRGCVRSSFDNLMSHWAYFRNQYPDPFDPTLPRDSTYLAPQWLGKACRALAAVQCFWPLRLLLLILATAPLITTWRQRAATGEKPFGLAVGLWLVALYFIAMAGTSFAVGFRVLFPIEVVLVVMSVWGIGQISDRIRARRH